MICGFTGEYEPGLGSSQFGKMVSLALVCSPSEIVQAGSSWMSEGPIWGMPLTAADEENYFSYEHNMFGEQIELIYQLRAGRDIRGILWLNPAQDQSVSILNRRTNTYDTVFADGVRLEGERLRDYISSRRQLQVKVVLDPSRTTNYVNVIPALEVYGGDKDD